MVYWLKHHNPDVAIVPILVPGMGFPHLVELASRIDLALQHLMDAASAFGNVVAKPVACATPVGWPELPAEGLRVGHTVPANLYHLVGYPGIVLTQEKTGEPPRFIGPPERKPPALTKP